MTENNESAEPTDETPVAPDRVPEPESAAETPRASRVPSWVTRGRLIATGAATAIFLGGGVAGYAVGNAGNDDHGPRPFPGAGQFDRGGFGPNQGQMPGGQQVPGQQGQQAPQGSSGSDS